MQQAASPPDVPEDLVPRLKEAVTMHGIGPVAKHLGVSRQTLATLLAGLPVRRGSLLAIEGGLRTWSAT